jgi:hypothetical protein
MEENSGFVNHATPYGYYESGWSFVLGLRRLAGLLLPE